MLSFRCETVALDVNFRSTPELVEFTNAVFSALMAEPDAVVVYIAPLPFPSMAALDDNQLWRRLPAVREGRLVGLPPVWLGNGLPSLIAFSRLLAAHWPGGPKSPRESV